MKLFSMFGFICLAFLAIIILSIGAPLSAYCLPDSNTHNNGNMHEGFNIMNPMQYTLFPDNSPTDLIHDNNNISSVGEEYVKLSGYSGLQSSPNTIHKPLDIYSQATSSTTCQSYGLMNSTGHLCLNPEQIRLLQTRGGNLTGADSNIGLGN